MAVIVTMLCAIGDEQCETKELVGKSSCKVRNGFRFKHEIP